MIQLMFPVTLESFAAYQRQLVGRELTDNEQEACAAWVPIFNDAYKKGKAENQEALVEDVDRMDQLIAEHEANKILRRFFRGARRWIVYAWDQGRKDTGKAVAV